MDARLILMYFFILIVITFLLTTFQIQFTNGIETTSTPNDLHDFWTKYYNGDNRPNRTWHFNTSSTYDVSRLVTYQPVDGNYMYDDEFGGSVMTSDVSFQPNVKYDFNVKSSFPDVRDPRCLNVTYMTALPIASVIIVFHDEVESALVRTLWTVINRSPIELLKEIILVNDANQSDFKKVLDEQFAAQPIEILYLRTEKREGHAQARMIGARRATGNVLIFLDVNVECLQGWLEPLLNRIANDRSVIVVPQVNAISTRNMKLIPKKRFDSHFGWTWDLLYKRFDIPQEEEDRRNYDEIRPYRTVTTIGCATAIDRTFFFEIGGFDEGIELQDAMNTELSMRVWLCGGTIEIVPCSQVAYLFRSVQNSFSIEKHQSIMRSNVRVAEMWMDEYKDVYYVHHPEAHMIDPGNLTKSSELKRKLKCQNFQWILDNVYTQSVLQSGIVQTGPIIQIAGAFCLDSFTGGLNVAIRASKCQKLSGSRQGFVYLRSNQLAVAESHCVGIGGPIIHEDQRVSHQVVLVECDASDEAQKWEIEPNKLNGYMTIKHSMTNLCMERSKPKDFIFVLDCDGENIKQMWNWMNMP